VLILQEVYPPPRFTSKSTLSTRLKIYEAMFMIINNHIFLNGLLKLTAVRNLAFIRF